MRYSSDSLLQLSLALLKSFGCDEQEATIVADHLVNANLSGHDSHGIGMLPMYGKQIQGGSLVPNQTPDLFPPTGAVTCVDARRGFGHHMALLSLDHAMKTIPEHKVAILGMRNAGHVSRVGTYSEYCASKGYVSIHMVNVVGHDSIVAPHGSRESAISTNPISMAMAVNNTASPLLDMATSKVAFGKARVAHNKGVDMPDGCLIDSEGVPTNNPSPMVENRDGALTAFGEHKGSGLGLFVELFAGALVSRDTAADAEKTPHGAINALFSVILDPAAFDDVSAFESRANLFCDYVKNLKPAKGTDEVLLPGEPEIRARADRNANGIDVDPHTIDELLDIGSEFELDRNTLQTLLETV